MYEDFIDNDGVKDNVEFLDELHVEDKMKTIPILNPTPEWFTANMWDNIHDPSPSMKTYVTSWQKGDQLTKGMLFKNKLRYNMHYICTLWSIIRNISPSSLTSIG